MSHKILRRLPSLAQPLLVIPQQNTEIDEEYTPLPALPEIGQDWDGFFISHLRLMGIRKDASLPKRFESVTLNHEAIHDELSRLPLGLIQKSVVLSKLLIGFESVLLEDIEPLIVPLIPNESGNEFQKAWNYVIFLNNNARIVEEVVAVWWSLKMAVEDGSLTNAQRREYGIRLIKEYDRTMRGPAFSVAYGMFTSLADRIGFHGAIRLAQAALQTYKAAYAFLDLLDYTLHFIHHTPSFANWSDRQIRVFYHKFLDTVDEYAEEEDRTLGFEYGMYGWRVLHKHLRMTLKKFEQLSESETYHYIRDFILNPTPDGHIHCEYDVNGLLSFPGQLNETLEEQEETILGYYILLESLRQQCTHGVGLRCPFWNPQRKTCCRFRDSLEQAWKNTTHDPSWPFWQREGCLKT